MEEIKKEFIEDHKKTNKGLHNLYKKWAIEHLKFIDLSIKGLSDFSNINMLDCIDVLQKERFKLINTNAAYYEADKYLKRLKNKVI
jgi:hypothetical protein